MSVHARTPAVLSIAVVFLFALTGCDKINNIFGKKEKDNKMAKAPAATPAPVADVKATPKPVAPAKDVLAQVGDWSITLPEFEERLINLKQAIPDIDVKDANARKFVLDEIVRQQLLVMEAEKTGVDKDKNISAAVEDFRRTLLVQELVNRKIKELVATEADAKKYYEENKDKLIKPVQWKVREILVYTESSAKEILAKVLQGGDFAELAKTSSKSKTAANGGELPVFTAEEAPFPEILSAISILNAGGVSAVFKGPEGFYIVKVEEKQGGEPIAFDELKEQLIQGLTFEKQNTTIQEYLEELKSKASIVTNEALLGLPESETPKP